MRARLSLDRKFYRYPSALGSSPPLRANPRFPPRGTERLDDRGSGARGGGAKGRRGGENDLFPVLGYPPAARRAALRLVQAVVVNQRSAAPRAQTRGSSATPFSLALDIVDMRLLSSRENKASAASRAERGERGERGRKASSRMLLASLQGNRERSREPTPPPLRDLSAPWKAERGSPGGTAFPWTSPVAEREAAKRSRDGARALAAKETKRKNDHLLFFDSGEGRGASGLFFFLSFRFGALGARLTSSNHFLRQKKNLSGALQQESGVSSSSSLSLLHSHHHLPVVVELALLEGLVPFSRGRPLARDRQPEKPLFFSLDDACVDTVNVRCSPPRSRALGGLARAQCRALEAGSFFLRADGGSEGR